MPNKIQDCHVKGCVHEEEISLHQQNGLKFKEENSKFPLG